MDQQSLTKKQNRQEDKRGLILAAARKLMAEQGGDFTASAIAQQLGWKTPGIYYYFPNLQAIREAILLELTGESVEITRSAAHLGKDVIESVTLAFEARIHHYQAHPGDFDLLWKHYPAGGIPLEVLQEDIYPQVQSLMDELEEMLEDGKAQGLVGLEVESRKLVNLMVCMAQGINLMYLSFKKVEGDLKFSLEEMILEGKKNLEKALKA